MYLEITDKTNVLGDTNKLKEFVEFVKEEILNYSKDYSTYDVELVNLWDSYIKKEINKDLDFFTIINEYFNNLEINKVDNETYRIEGSSTATLNSFELEVLASMINDGNLEMVGYPYIEATFDLFDSLIPTLYKQWGL